MKGLFEKDNQRGNEWDVKRVEDEEEERDSVRERSPS